MVEVEQADRKAATSYLSPAKERTVEGLIQAFARHRIAERERNAGICDSAAEAYAKCLKVADSDVAQSAHETATLLAQAIRAASDD